MAKKQHKALDLSTEEKIKNAALKLFTKKGFAATRTRDISVEAGINLALLNYYYGSKEKLFELVMTEILQNFFRGIAQIFNDEKTSLDEKVNVFVDRYTALLKVQPDLPLFIFHELRLDPKRLATKMGVNIVFKSFFFKQLNTAISKKKIARIHPLHYVINIIALCVFPFIAAPLLKHIGGMDEKSFGALLDERRELVPKWIQSIMLAR
ncbi:MAG: TetR family transcriptional regulator [Bacteroidota bacterium]|nr:TetR family transcriptional regulator [Bacteroidota bacterium]